MSSVRAILYRSVATGSTRDVDLYDLLAHALQRNRADEVMGMLLHDRGGYFQWLEGDADAVEAVLQRLRADPRHAGLTLLPDRTKSARRYAGSPMHFAHHDADHALAVSGFPSIDRDALDAMHDDPACASERLPAGVRPPEPVVPVALPACTLASCAAGPALAIRRSRALRSWLATTGGALVSATQRLRDEIVLSRESRDLPGSLRSCPAMPA